LRLEEGVTSVSLFCARAVGFDHVFLNVYAQPPTRKLRTVTTTDVSAVLERYAERAGAFEEEMEPLSTDVDFAVCLAASHRVGEAFYASSIGERRCAFLQLRQGRIVRGVLTNLSTNRVLRFEETRCEVGRFEQRADPLAPFNSALQEIMETSEQFDTLFRGNLSRDVTVYTLIEGRVLVSPPKMARF
jgi:hypothetical protein